MGMGRPRGFDLDEATDRAMEVFWAKGYDGASVADLTQAMGINAPSLYAAFGSKEGLFRAVLDRYAAKRIPFLDEALRAPSARETVERLLASAARLYAEGEGEEQRGCLLVQGGLTCGCTAVSDELAKRRARLENILRERFAKAVEAGDLDPAADLTTLARYIVSVLNGMGIQAAGGASRADLEAVASVALKAFPEAPQAKPEAALASPERGS